MITSGQAEVDRNASKQLPRLILSAPTPQQVEIVHAGLTQGAKPSAAAMYSKARSQEALQAYRQAKTADVKAALLPGFARRRDYDAIPTHCSGYQERQCGTLSGSAVAAAQYLLGVRYEISMSQLQDPNFRNEIADMVMQDWHQLQKYPKFKENIGS